MLTMVFGAFIAGGTSEGGGAVAFPVFTLLLDIKPEVARNFSFAIQSIGMTSASLLILDKKILIEKRTILYASLGGVIGIVVGTLAVIQYLSGSFLKMFFVSLWLGFGIALYFINKNKDREINQAIPLHFKKTNLRLFCVGIVGGFISSLFGNGIDIITFCFLTLYFGVCEKVATPTSVILMAINTIIGFFLHAFVVKDFGFVEFRYWLAAISVVIVFAPLGAYIISFLSRNTIANFLYLVVLAQYIGALFILNLNGWPLVFSFSVVILSFFLFKRLNNTNAYKSIS